MSVEVVCIDNTAEGDVDNNVALDAELLAQAEELEDSNVWEYCVVMEGFDENDDSRAHGNFRAIVALMKRKFGQENVSAVARGQLDTKHAFIMVKATLSQLEATAEQEKFMLPATKKQARESALREDPVNLPFGVALKKQFNFVHPNKAECPKPEACACNLLTPAQQQELVRVLIDEVLDSHLEELEDRPVSKGRGEMELIRRKVIVALFPLHKNCGGFYSSLTSVLNKYTGVKGSFKSSFVFTESSNQFRSFVRDYFGEKVALYFSFLHHMNAWLLVLAVVGGVVSLVQKADSIDNPLVPIFSVFLVIWATLMLKFWNRRNNDLAHEWGMLEYENQERELESFVREAEDSMRNENEEKRMEPVFGFYEPTGRWVDLTAWSDRVIAENGEHVQRFIPRSYRDVSGRCPNIFISWYGTRGERGDVARAELNAILYRTWKQLVGKSVVLTLIGMVVVVSLSMLVLKQVLSVYKLSGDVAAGAVNAISIAILDFVYKKVAIKMTEWENHRTATQFEDNLVLKFFVFQFINSYFTLFYIAFVQTYNISLFGHKMNRAEAKEFDEIGELSSQLASVLLTRVIIGNVTETLLPWIKHKFSMWNMARQRRALIRRQHPDATRAEIAELARLDSQTYEGERQAQKLRYEMHPYVSGVFDDYNELAIGYGYVILFGSAFPLVAVFLLFSNIVENGTDAWKIIKTSQKPRAWGARDMGNHTLIMKFLTAAAVVTNTLLIVFTSSQLDKLFYGSDQDEDQNWTERLLIAVIFEHIIFVFLFILNRSINDMRPSLRETLARDDVVKTIMSEFEGWKQGTEKSNADKAEARKARALRHESHERKESGSAVQSPDQITVKLVEEHDSFRS